ncbi:unnamed protein product [Darwinula stevensoni]|uniref:BOS complex subunit NCLN n=1 Tax=Darwinula stevensoni TaxID=69355 RepID=A0A7R9AA25_9CRUS|nr:unnamed protein product [Darwinula stevensoni]CAG0897859.1 unnamed protein product [Darwinula stevensoni]
MARMGSLDALPLVYVTGFGPFVGHDVNASWEAVKLLPRLLGREDRVQLVVEEIPVDYDFVMREIPRRWRELDPHLVVHVGVSSTCEGVTLEQCANNVGYQRPDMRKCCPMKGKCRRDVEDTCIVSSLDMHSLSLRANTSVPPPPILVLVSRNAGRYLCEFTYFTSLSVDLSRTAFIHVPTVSPNVSAHDIAVTLKACILAMLESLSAATACVVEKQMVGIRRPRGLTNGQIFVAIVLGVIGGVYIWKPVFAPQKLKENPTKIQQGKKHFDLRRLAKSFGTGLIYVVIGAGLIGMYASGWKWALKDSSSYEGDTTDAAMMNSDSEHRPGTRTLIVRQGQSCVICVIMSGLDYLDLILPYYLLIALPVFIIFAPITPALAGHDFNVYRMQQFDVQGTQYGSRNAPVSMEARTLAAKNVMRKCVVARWTEILQEGGLELWRRLHSLGVGALLIILPQNMSSFTSSELEVSLDLESAMLNEETDIPVYFALESPEVMDIYWEMHHGSLADSSPSAAHALMQAVVSSGYSLHTAGSGSKIINNAEIASIQGRLPAETGENVPTIAIIAHYDSFGMAPDLSFGVDSNGSGAAMLLELVRLFSHAFEDMGKRAPANILFLLSGGGKLNFQGTRRWLEDQLDGLEGGLLQEVGFTLCLDTVGGAEDSLFLHVSKPPKPGTPAHEFLTVLEDIASHLYPSVNVSIVHRKINLNAEQLLWEHQRLSLRRIPAFTLSGLQYHEIGLNNIYEYHNHD